VSCQDRAVILPFLYAGFRISELVDLQLNDLDLLTLNLKVVGKGGKYREVPMKPEASAAIKDYLAEERKSHPRVDSPYPFLTQRAGRMNWHTVNKLLHSHGKQLALKIYHHKFPHTFCSQLLKKQVDLTTVARLAGH